MTILEALREAPEAQLDALIGGSYAPIETAKWDNRSTWDDKGRSFDNRKTWDNWNKKR